MRKSLWKTDMLLTGRVEYFQLSIRIRAQEQDGLNYKNTEQVHFTTFSVSEFYCLNFDLYQISPKLGSHFHLITEIILYTLANVGWKGTS